MAQTPLIETRHTGGFMVSMANGHRSIDRGLITGSAKLLCGTVLGKTLTTATATTTAGGSNTGNGVMGAVTVTGQAKQGAYILRITKAAVNAGDFEVIDPNGEVAGLGSVAAAYSQGGLAFTLADGSADFVVGDTIAILVVGTVKYNVWTPTATDGTQVVAGILYADADATAADVNQAVVTRAAEVNASELIWFGGATNTQIAAGTVQLGAIGIIAR